MLGRLLRYKVVGDVSGVEHDVAGFCCWFIVECYVTLRSTLLSIITFFLLGNLSLQRCCHSFPGPEVSFCTLPAWLLDVSLVRHDKTTKVRRAGVSGGWLKSLSSRELLGSASVPVVSPVVPAAAAAPLFSWVASADSSVFGVSLLLAPHLHSLILRPDFV